MAMQIGGGSQTSMSDINITPLVDVMLVLLVIFMVTAPMLSAKKTQVKLPAVETGETLELKEDDMILVLHLDRTIHFYNCASCRSMTLDTLVSTLKENPKLKQKRMVYLYGDQQLPYRFVLQVMAKLNEAGAPHVGLVTDPAGLPSSQTTPPSQRR